MNQLTRENMLENATARLAKQIKNDTGIKIDISTLTGIKARVTEQKFYEVTPSDFMPVEVGQNPWAIESLTYRAFSTGSDFETGIIARGSNNSRLERSDARIDGVKVPRKEWGKTITYNIPELLQAQQANNWSLIESKEQARFKNWQLGIQKHAFLGLGGDMKGLLTQDDVNINTTRITKYIKDMSVTEFNEFLSGFFGDYFTNAGATVLPTHFVIPMTDYLGLASAVDESFPLKSRLERIKEVGATFVQGFQVKGLAYSDSARNGLGVDRYVLYRGDDASGLTMEIPVDYTTTIYDTVNGFNYESVGYGQFGSVQTFRPAEMLYFDF